MGQTELDSSWIQVAHLESSGGRKTQTATAWSSDQKHNFLQDMSPEFSSRVRMSMTNMLPGRAWAQSSDHETAPSAIKPFAPTNVTSVPHNGSRTSSRLRMAERSDANVFVLPPASNVSETASEAQNLPLQLNIQKYPELHAPHKKLLRGQIGRNGGGKEVPCWAAESRLPRSKPGS